MRVKRRGGGEEEAENRTTITDLLPNAARNNKHTQEAGAHVAMGDKKCGHAVAHGDAVCARVCAEGRRANSNAQQADVVHRERRSRARAARGGERREEGGRTDGAHGRRKTTPRTTAVWR